MASPLTSRAAALRRPSSFRTITAGPSQWARHSSSSGPTPRSGARAIGLLTVMVASGAGALWAYPHLVSQPPEAAGPKQIEKAEIVYEKPRKKAASKEESRDIVSSQHLQVKKSWEHPGVYAWGSNAGKVVAPDSDETVIKTPRRIPYFDGQILRDLKLDRDFGVAVNEKGDLLQWGTGFSKDAVAPTATLTGKGISKIAISRDRIIALSSNGSVYSIPVAKSDQAMGEKQTSKSSWLPFCGLQHCLLLTSKGRVFSAASSSEEFPSKGQLGVPGLTWQTRPSGPYDQPHEVKSLSGSNIKSIATGAFHSLALDDKGRVFSFGDNTTGQLGRETPIGAVVDTPSPLPISNLYSGTNMLPKVTAIAAGGHNSYFTVDATKTQSQTPSEAGRTVADTWACGAGIHGGLGTGKWTHVSATPTKIKSLSSLYEYDEAANRITPIRLAQLAVGSTHACAILDNLTRLTASRASASETDTNFGADVLWWGGNEHYQLGTGKRNNANVPVHIGPLDGGRADAQVGRKGDLDQRFQITPRTKVRLGEDGKGRTASVEQRVECGRYVTAVYSAA
ncbi:regulator of chromosome condensation 1/beta-lactamase-inhibitor protein II [Chaetomium sp. MPI-CAGE-AT-0009]|nr:regulator of chromosome condensation 1/beta-lactamase-inhibitor protein II [Chaetomium sp. MPI-CAGE-AT-0009]